jgi:hypothetical protein
MACQITRQASVLLSMGLIMLMAVMGCETAKPDETPRLIMEPTDEMAVTPGQLEPSGPSGLSSPR